MRDEHIIDVLDRGPLEGLTDDERSRVESHARACAACSRAYEAARVATGLVAARAAAVVAPSPFFQTRVMAAVRERRAAAEENSLARLWRASRSVVSAMAAAVVLLAGAAYVTSQPDTASGVATAPAVYSAEWDAIDTPQQKLSDDQLVAILYDSEDVYGQGR